MTKYFLYIKTNALYTLMLLWGGIHASIAYYFESIFISSQSGRVFLFDSIGLILFIWCFFWHSSTQERFKSNKGFFILIIFLIYLTFTALFKGLINNNDTALILKELHVLVFAMIILGFIWCVGIRQAILVQKQIFHGAAIGTGLIVFIAYTIFPSTETFNYALENYGNAMEFAPLASLYGHKIKIVPYLMSFLSAYYMWSFLYAKNLRIYAHSVLIILLLILLAILSNMRSAIIGVVLGALICMSTLFYLRGNILRALRLLVLSLAGSIMLGFIWVEHLSDDRWVQSQIVEKATIGTLQQDTSRIKVMMQSFGITQDGSIDGGYGMGAGFSYHGNILADVNPGDSGFYHIYITHGLLFVYLIIVLLVYACMRMFRIAVITRGRYEQRVVIANLAGIITLLLSHFNDSCWVFIPDVIAASFILAIAFLYRPGRLGGLT